MVLNRTLCAYPADSPLRAAISYASPRPLTKPSKEAAPSLFLGHLALLALEFVRYHLFPLFSAIVSTELLEMRLKILVTLHVSSHHRHGNFRFIDPGIFLRGQLYVKIKGFRELLREDKTFFYRLLLNFDVDV